ncbi:Lcl C-terminal domain-containing protein [Legionella clemsonensis]|uniref:Protein with a bacterial immunoglobulin-like domain protein n=1 Tax=Legionella clemsonensis TaxID=1867846 RepID=A0A222P6L2_9GAMM|nr:DUF1566 domain-containing protein [Legionella clemsonensis]ASQ47437.1 hypothetical protein clem_14555 [Legionella clemsonensis]
MKRIFNRFLLGVALLFLAVGGQAGTPQPKFSVEVKVRAPLELINSGIGFAQYSITNNTTITRRLTLVPIPGVQVMSSGCSSVFTLAPGGSCLLNLRLVGSAMGAGVHGGPIICKTKGSTNEPDRFLCSQPRSAELLNVTIIPTPSAIISVNPGILRFAQNGSASVTVTNSAASTRAAANVMAQIPSTSPLRVQSSTCPVNLAPGVSCQITFTSAIPTTTTVRIQGSNTNAVNVSVVVTASLIRISPTSLTFAVNSTGSVTVTNLAGLPALNVAASIPAGSSITVTNSTCPASLAVGANCTIEFTGTVQETTQVAIRGTNTNTELLSITVAAQPVLVVSPLRAIITVDGTSPQTLVTVTNTSTLFTATQVSAELPAAWGGNVVQDSSDCVTIAPGTSCTLAFSSNFFVAQPQIGIAVRGDNTATTTFGLAFFTDGGLVYDIDGGGNIYIVAEEDLAPNIWGASVATGATSDTDGATNTTLIAGASANGAAVECNNLVLNTFNDWYLPAIEELIFIYTNVHLLGFGDFTNTNYWSSTEDVGDPITNALPLNFANGVEISTAKNTTLNVRCARITPSA